MLSNSLFLVGEHSLDRSLSVSKELGINALQGGVSLSLGLVNSVAVGLLVLVVGSVVLGLSHIYYRRRILNDYC